MDEYFSLKDNMSHFWNTLVSNKMHTCTFFRIMMLLYKTQYMLSSFSA